MTKYQINVQLPPETVENLKKKKMFLVAFKNISSGDSSKPSHEFTSIRPRIWFSKENSSLDTDNLISWNDHYSMFVVANDDEKNKSTIEINTGEVANVDSLNGHISLSIDPNRNGLQDTYSVINPTDIEHVVTGLSQEVNDSKKPYPIHAIVLSKNQPHSFDKPKESILLGFSTKNVPGAELTETLKGYLIEFPLATNDIIDSNVVQGMLLSIHYCFFFSNHLLLYVFSCNSVIYQR